MITVSCTVNKGLYSVAILDKGVLVSNVTNRVKESKGYDTWFEALSNAVRMLRSYIESHDTDCQVLFELGNSVVAKWLNKGMSNSNYITKTAELFNLIDSIPIQYEFRGTNTPFSKDYCKEKYLVKPKLSGLDDMV